MARDFTADTPNTKRVTEITYIRTAEHWLYLCIVLDLHSEIVVVWSMSHQQEHQLVIQAVLIALWQRADRLPVMRFLAGHNLICSICSDGSCADNATAEGFFGMLKRERINQRQYQTRA